MTLILPETSAAESGVNIDSGDSFWIENHHQSETMRFKWANVPYNIAPLKKRIVPFEVICLNFGDPRSKVGSAVPYKDSRGSGMVPERMGEVRRLSIRYGVYEQGMENIHEALKSENNRLSIFSESHMGLPVKLMNDINFYAKIKSLEDIEILTPLFDPDGSITYGYTLDDQKSQDLSVIISQLTNRVRQLEGQKETLDVQGDNDDNGISIDNPEGIQ
jgi:hypothetical protein